MRERRKKRKIRQFFIVIVFWIAIAVLIMSLIGNANAKYTTVGSSSASVDLAYYLLKEGAISQSLKLPSILPRVAPYTYSFSVANYNGNERTQTALDYVIKIKTTTNLPLEYTVTKQGNNTNLITNTVSQQDSDGTYFKYITVQGDTFGFRQNQENVYVISITFPVAYNSADYEDIIEYIEITVDSSQKIN